MLNHPVSLFPLLLTLLTLFTFTSSSEPSEQKQKEDEELYRKLFMPEYQKKLLEKDVTGAREAFVQAKGIEMSFLTPNAGDLIQKMVEIEVGEVVTEEAIRVPRFNTLEEAKRAFREPKVQKKREERIGYLQQQRNYVQEQSASYWRPVLDTIKAVTPSNYHSALSYIDPLIFSPTAEDYQMELEQVQRELMKRDKFIDEHPKWFLNKTYYNKDQFGLDRAMAKLEKKGHGVSVMIMDFFCGVVPLALKGKCTNADQFKLALEDVEESKRDRHGVAVASVVVDDEVGVAPGATFTAVSVVKYFPIVSSLLKEPPVDVHYSIDFPGDAILPHHLAQMDFFLREKGAKFVVKIDENQYHTIDASTKDLPTEEIINMSIAYMDNIGEQRNSKYTKQRLMNFVGFATMVLRFVQAGKLIVWASGNEAMVQGDSTSYTLMKALTEFLPGSFVNALALCRDGTTLSEFTNQPGSHMIKKYSLAAPGKEVRVMSLDGTYRTGNGTSYSAPYIAGAVALVRSNYPEVPMDLITKSLLFMASPVVMVPNPSRLTDTPVVIRSTRSGLLEPGPREYYNPKGIEKTIDVTQQMIERGREKYGAGIINISGACTLLERYNEKPDAVVGVLNHYFK